MEAGETRKVSRGFVAAASCNRRSTQEIGIGRGTFHLLPTRALMAPTSARLLLVRHGETDENVAGVYALARCATHRQASSRGSSTHC